MSIIDQDLESTEEESRSWEDLGHKLYSKQHKEYHTEINSPDSMSTLDTAAEGLIVEEFGGTGLDKDLKKWRDWKRTNYIAFKRKRAQETERMVSANAQRENERNEFRQKLLGDLGR
jgi:hypothetical protein